MVNRARQRTNYSRPWGLDVETEEPVSAEEVEAVESEITAVGGSVEHGLNPEETGVDDDMESRPTTGQSVNL